MEVIRRFELELRPPRHGWLPLRLQLGTFAIDCEASHVLNDPVGELIDLVAFCRSPYASSRRVWLWLEPDAYSIDFAINAPFNRCVIRVSYGKSVSPPGLGSKLELLFEGEADVGVVRHALWSALTDFVETNGPAVLSAWKRSQEYGKRLTAIRFSAARERPSD